MRTRLKRFLALTRRERSLLIVASILVGAARILVPVAGFRRARRAVGWLAGAARRASERSSPAELALAVTRASRRVTGANTCLYRAVVLDGWLRSAGHDSQLHVGFEPGEGDRKRGHAWVTSGGETLVGGEDVLALAGAAGAVVRQGDGGR